MPIDLQLDRRMLLKTLMLLSGAAAVRGNALFAQDAAVGAPLPARREGELDIHHIDTARGNCALIVAPDGTTIMVDAGDTRGPAGTTSAPRPDGARRAGEYQARYAARYTPGPRLDYFLATHIHQDHVGDTDQDSPRSPDGSYKLTGVSDVDHLLPITTVIDRAYPDYGNKLPPAAPFATNYLAFLKSRIASGRKVERAHVGSDRQITLANPQRYPSFHTRILSANGEVWSGHADKTTSMLPDLSAASVSGHTSENLFSVALRVEYGRFSYFTGGDLCCDTHDGAFPWMNVETPVVRAASRTEVAVADHHGYFDACGPEFVRSLDAQAYIIPAWDIGHPGSAQMQRMLGAWDTAPTHDVFATGLLPANELLNRRFASQMKSREGHVVVRVAAGGDSYRIFNVDSTTEIGNVKAVFGPYQCRP